MIIKLTKTFLNQKKLAIVILIAFGLIFPVILSVNNILADGMAFWFDPARDFILALANLKKITLIGQSTGIPGLFYGPYWIWLISLFLLISRDPRLVVLLLVSIPYLIFFPYLLLSFKKLFNNGLWVVLWLLYYYSFSGTINALWNPNLAPLLFLFLIYLISKIDIDKLDLKTTFLSGTIIGFLINVHYSFGLGILIGTIFYIPLSVFFIRQNRRGINIIAAVLKQLFFIGTGLITTFLPFILFEIRHGFNQVKSVTEAIIKAVLYNSAVVGQQGLTKTQIIQAFFSRMIKLTGLPLRIDLFVILLCVAAVCLINKLRKQKVSSPVEQKVLIYMSFCLLSILLLYLKSKNPVWDYHFIGIEVIFLLYIGILAREFNIVRYLLFTWVIILTSVNLFKIVKSQDFNPYTISSLHTKKHIVDIVYQDASTSAFSVFVYSPAIYTYDFDYIFNWFGEKKYSVLPNRDLTTSRFVYLIIPSTSEAVKQDFINYRTPSNQYSTSYEWTIEDGTSIIKRYRFLDNYAD